MAFTEADIDRVRQAAAEVIEKHHLPGIAIGVVSGSDLVYSEGFGYADIESQEPQRPERAQRIASITKTMVGLSTMALVDEGRLSLDDRAVDHLPELAFDGPGDQIRIRHLLTHTSGIGEAPTRDALIATVNPNPGERAQPGGFDSLYPNGIVVEAQPGTKWAYSNNGFAPCPHREGNAARDLEQAHLRAARHEGQPRARHAASGADDRLSPAGH